MSGLLIWTSNQWKIDMYSKILSDLELGDLDIYYLSDFEDVPDPIENADTVKGNALLKAKYYSSKFDIDVLAGDAGFAIKALDWKPWVKARRWGGELDDDVSDEEFLEFFLDKIKDLPVNDDGLIEASFPFVRCIYTTDGREYYQEGSIEIYLQKTPREPIKQWWPVQSCLVYPDGRHAYDIDEDDPIWEKNFQVSWLRKLLSNLNT